MCLHSPQLSPIILRCEGGGQKPDVTSFFDGFISLLPVGSSPSFSSKKDSEGKIHPKHTRKYEDSRHLQQLKHAVATSSNFPASPVASTVHSSVPETDIRQLKHVLDTINTTKAVAKITLTQQVRRHRLDPYFVSVCNRIRVLKSSLVYITPLQERLWRRAFQFFDENKARSQQSRRACHVDILFCFFRTARYRPRSVKTFCENVSVHISLAAASKHPMLKHRVIAIRNSASCSCYYTGMHRPAVLPR